MPPRRKKTEEPADDRLGPDLLRGAQAIADFLGWPVRKVRHGLVRGYIPAVKDGNLYVASKRRLRRHYEGGVA